MTEKHWCVHEVDVLKVRSNYVYLLEVQIHWRESRSNHVLLCTNTHILHIISRFLILQVLTSPQKYIKIYINVYKGSTSQRFQCIQ